MYQTFYLLSTKNKDNMKFLEKAFLPVKNKETQVPPWPPEEKKKREREKKQRQSFALRFTPIFF